MEGDAIGELHGHTSFVYSLGILPNGDLISSGEDRTARVWRDTSLLQTMTQPCVSVWAVAALVNGDVVAGGSDGVLRVFTRDEKLVADPQILKAYEESLAASAIPSNQVGDVDKSKLPGLEALNELGTHDGQVKMIRVNNAVEAHQWSDAQTLWVKIGEVVDAVGNSRKQIFMGKEYDYVFDVDIQDGVPPLKLPYNATDNPYEAAQDFIHRNELPQDYLDQVANFIIKNTKANTIGSAPSQGDPFTGSNRYVPQPQVSNSSPSVQLPPSGFKLHKIPMVSTLI